MPRRADSLRRQPGSALQPDSFVVVEIDCVQILSGPGRPAAGGEAVGHAQASSMAPFEIVAEIARPEKTCCAGWVCTSSIGGTGCTSELLVAVGRRRALAPRRERLDHPGIDE